MPCFLKCNLNENEGSKLIMRQKKGFSFYFYFFSLKFFYFDLKYYFIYILVIKFESGERGSLENNKREKIISYLVLKQCFIFFYFKKLYLRS
jgi:hypothetical protein